MGDRSIDYAVKARQALNPPVSVYRVPTGGTIRQTTLADYWRAKSTTQDINQNISDINKLKLQIDIDGVDPRSVVARNQIRNAITVINQQTRQQGLQQGTQAVIILSTLGAQVAIQSANQGAVGIQNKYVAKANQVARTQPQRLSTSNVNANKTPSPNLKPVSSTPLPNLATLKRTPTSVGKIPNSANNSYKFGTVNGSITLLRNFLKCY